MRRFLFIAMIFLVPSFLHAADSGAVKKDTKLQKGVSPVEAFSFGDAFISQIGSTDLIKRDALIASKLNLLIESIAVVRSVEEHPQFRKKYRIVAQLPPVSGITIQYHIYTENEEYLTLLAEGQKFAFKGQLVMLTPVNSRRDFYILDVILQEG
ncbi:MAG TPA: hypothetical protein VF857_00910, partial [Spirochaetota bacterium]